MSAHFLVRVHVLMHRVVLAFISEYEKTNLNLNILA